ncbi:MAG: amidohydrolase family protein [Myxococcales bacterium]|nr:amidohydrolase family protein [Myxococcales bacterium]
MHATIWPATGSPIEDGTIILQDGYIQAVGLASEVEIPENAEVVDAEARIVTPGLIDTHSHMGVYATPHVEATSDGNEATSPVTAEVWAADSVWPQDPGLGRALAGGVTTIHVLPGSANLIGGRGVTLKLRLDGVRSVSDLRVANAPDTLKMACGENPKRVYGNRKTAPSTLMGSVAGYRAAFQRAVEYRRTWMEWKGKQDAWAKKKQDKEKGKGAGQAPMPPSRDFSLDTLVSVLEGDTLVQMHCYRADEMVRMLELAQEFGFRIRSFHHAVEAYKIRDILARADVAINTWPDWWGFKMEAFDAIPENLALVTAEGGRAVVHSDSAMLVQRLNQEAAKGQTAGRRSGIEITDNQALRWITAHAAWVLGLDGNLGTLEQGKVADVVIWSANPLSVYSRADLVFVEGRLAYSRAMDPYGIRSDFEIDREGF